MRSPMNVGGKKNQRRTWHAAERKTGVILAWRNGRRTDESCPLLMTKLSAFPAASYYTDDQQSCRKYLPPLEHISGKADTWRIEKRNLFRTHIKRLNRKTIFFKKKKIYDNVIGMHINRYYLQNGRYSENI